MSWNVCFWETAYLPLPKPGRWAVSQKHTFQGTEAFLKSGNDKTAKELIRSQDLQNSAFPNDWKNKVNVLENPGEINIQGSS